MTKFENIENLNVSHYSMTGVVIYSGIIAVDPSEIEDCDNISQIECDGYIEIAHIRDGKIVTETL